MLNDNIKTQWAEIRTEAIELWIRDIESDMIPELDARGIVVNSKSIQSPAGNTDAAIIWMCDKQGQYMEIKAMTNRAFSVELFVEGGKPIRWPSQSYQDKHVSVAGLLEWIDSQGL